MDLLDKIIASKKNEVERKKKLFPVSRFEDSLFFKHEMPSFYKALAKPGPHVIGEFKRKSPSNGIINPNAEVKQVATGYAEAGISAVSILTDGEFFGGDVNDLLNVAGFVNIPLLRKDFILDEYQVLESKSIGASSILLIAAILSKNEAGVLTELSLSLGMDVLFEIHEERDLEKMNHKIKIIGVNNRDLRTLRVNIEHSGKLVTHLPGNCLKVAESGIQTCQDVANLFSAGYNAFLIGGKFMNSENPVKAASKFMKDLRKGME